MEEQQFKQSLNDELEQLSLELSELNKEYADKYNRFNQLLAKWKKENLK